MKPTEERKPFTATHQKNFRVARAGVVTEENDGSSVFGD
jgi:hypothetical protein